MAKSFQFPTIKTRQIREAAAAEDLALSIEIKDKLKRRLDARHKLEDRRLNNYSKEVWE